MSFDPRSLERLRQLGRQLPQPLSQPTPPSGSSTKPSAKRHRVETEDDPQALFHELMKVSADGTVPDHLMDRLKQAEQKAEDLKRQDNDRRTQSDSRPFSQPGANSPQARRNEGNTRKGKNTRPIRPNVTTGSEEESLYVAFGQLILEDDEDTP